jgi:hypothetical protein
MSEIKAKTPENLEKERDLKTMTLDDFYENECLSAIYWDLVRRAHLCKK